MFPRYRLLHLCGLWPSTLWQDTDPSNQNQVCVYVQKENIHTEVTFTPRLFNVCVQLNDNYLGPYRY